MRERRGMGTDGSALRGLWWGLWIEAAMIAVGLMIRYHAFFYALARASHPAR